MITIKDLTKACNLSHVTVIRALRDDPIVAVQTRRRVKEIAQKINYTPNNVAKQLQSGKTNTVAVIVNDCYSGHIGRLLEGVQRDLGDRNYDTMTYEWSGTRSGVNDFVDKIVGRRVEGVMMVQWNHDYEMEFFRELLNRRVPVISIDREADYPGIPFAAPDEIQGAALAIAHLCQKGHKDIGHITGLPAHSSAKERLVGFYRAMSKHHLPVHSEWVVEGDYRYEGAIQAVNTFFDANRERLPTAIFAGSDVIAACVIQVAAKRGISIPDDISIVGFCDETFAQFLTPALSTIRQDPFTLASQGVELLIEAIEARHAEQENQLAGTRISIPVSLVERESVKDLNTM